MKTQYPKLFRSMALCALIAGGCDQSPAPSAANAPPAPSRAAAPPATPASATPPASTATPPQITFQSLAHDFGTISEVQPQTARFNFTNTGGQTLVIGQIKTACSCTAPVLAKREYQPGESGHIDITFTPAGPGNDPKLVNVFTNAPPANPNEPFVRLQILANVQAFVDIEPRKIELGVLPYRQPHEFTVTVSCPPDPNFTVESVKTTNPNIRAELQPRAPGETRQRIRIHIAPSATWGALFSWLDISMRGRPAPDAAPIVHTSKTRIQGQMFGQLRAEPWDTFRFGAKPGETFQRHIKITRTNSQPFELLSATIVRCDLPGATIAINKLAPNSYDLVLTATADRLRPMAEGIVSVTTNVPGEEQFEIPISGVVRADDPSVR